MVTLNKPIINLIGGGTGSFTLLQELKKLTPNIYSIVNMSDDGGSTGVLRDELGVLPPGDIRQCLVALSNTPEARDMFSYRFGGDGPLSGHTLGNLIISGLEQRYEDFEKALKAVSSILNITGKVIPVTLDQHNLVMKDGNEMVKGQYIIGNRPINNNNATIQTNPKVKLNPEAKSAILEADMIVIAPGNLYGSLLPALSVTGIRDALDATKAQIILVSNLVTKPGQTDSWHVVDYVNIIEDYIGKNNIDVVLYNNDLPTEELLKRYAAEGEYPVDTELSRFVEISAKSIGEKLIAKNMAIQDENDKSIKRTLIRHDAVQVANQLKKLLDN
jgi:uncharacterized cofD-like protein